MSSLRSVDAVTLRGLELKQMLTVKTGKGDDFVQLSNVINSGETSIVTGKGTDLIQLVNSTLGVVSEVNTGQRDDEVHIRGVLFGDSTFLDGGDGFDIIRREEIFDALITNFEEDFGDL